MLKSLPKRQKSALILTTLRAFRSVRSERSQILRHAPSPGAPRVACGVLPSCQAPHTSKKLVPRQRKSDRGVWGTDVCFLVPPQPSPRILGRFHFSAKIAKNPDVYIMLFSRFWPKILGLEFACNFIGALVDYPPVKF